MKGVILFIFSGLLLISLTGCYTVPRHYTQQVEIIYYVPDEPSYYPDPVIGYPEPPPSPSVYYPPTNGTNPQRDRLPEKPKDSYDQRDPLQGGNQRGSGNTNTLPPVRTPVQKDSGSQ